MEFQSLSGVKRPFFLRNFKIMFLAYFLIISVWIDDLLYLNSFVKCDIAKPAMSPSYIFKEWVKITFN